MNLSLNFTVDKKHEKLSVVVPSLECHITNELYQVIMNFYNMSFKQVRSLSTAVLC